MSDKEKTDWISALFHMAVQMKEIAFGLKIPCFVPISNLAKVDHALPLRWPTSMCCQN